MRLRGFYGKASFIAAACTAAWHFLLCAEIWFACCRSLGGKLLRQFTELRQQCCHPQIVRRDLWLGKSRLSMRQILRRLVLKAFTEYDIATRAEFTARVLQAAVSCDPSNAGALYMPCTLTSLTRCCLDHSLGALI